MTARRTLNPRDWNCREAIRKIIPSTAIAAVMSLSLLLSGCGTVMTLAISPKTLLDHAIEARSAEDIIADTRIVLAVNAIMVQLGTIQASSEVYEQRLLLTGLFDDRELYEEFHFEVKKIITLKKLYWHIRYVGKAEQKRLEKTGRIIGWADSLLLDAKVGLALIAQGDVADVNYRVAADSFSHVYVLGRARSKQELQIAMAASHSIESARKIVNYVEVRP